ncbi:hypothetical protein IW261DRAFT_132013 [Armillaria novae-zelandiae]|uniref:Uncharacterized protein n=1 Tax=Armillaria novae-zelandiae TaxID=153914 RepID=A0AA39NEF9_9AGAR|nr:hypothetical protein IW261DRAFT_132013 [Armillaria novae-zelandiae]
MKALNSMSAPKYRSEVLGSDIVTYIINEYRKAARLLGGLSDEWAPIQFMIRTSPAWEIINDILGDLPIIYCALVYVLYPERGQVNSACAWCVRCVCLRFSQDRMRSFAFILLRVCRYFCVKLYTNASPS